MDKLIIHGPSKLQGEVQVSRSKNAYLPIIAACLLSDRPVHLFNLPELRDIKTIIQLLQKMGAVISYEGLRTTIDCSKISSYEATYELVKTMRASILVLGPLLGRFKKGHVSLPGGCAIGARPIDIHLKNFEKMGAIINLDSGYVDAKTNGLKGCKLVLSFPSVGATENLMMGAVLAEGETIIENCALEPEIDDLAHFLNKMGAKISGIGTSIIKIIGVKNLKEVEYQAIGDRIEAATYLIAGLITKSLITIRGINPSFLDAVCVCLQEMGAKFKFGDDFIQILEVSHLRAIQVDTSPFPGFPTDVQAQLLTLATQVNGTSIITENIFENRFMHVPELNRLGAKIELKGNSAIVQGPTVLKSAPIMCTDLRASAALVLAALAAEGATEVFRIYHLERGYEKLEQKLRKLGAIIDRASGPAI